MSPSTTGATRDAIIARAAEFFERKYGTAPETVAVSPGRINIIGEHVDYAGGMCLPAAVDRYLAVAAAPARNFRLASDLFPGQDLAVERQEIKPTETWADHPLGVLRELDAEGIDGGLEVAIVSDVPPGSGLSSSAAVAVATTLAALAVAGREMEPYAVARLCRRSENAFLGVPSGLMDQVACVMGREDMALLFHADTEIVEGVRLPPTAAWLVCQSGIERSLRGSAYSERPAEAARALELARESYRGLRSLADLEPGEVEKLGLPPPLDLRARHIVGETQRVRLAVACLEAGNLDALGQLMTTSHRSLARDMEVSLRELDRLVDILMEAGCHGARLMGAGFGGSVLGLVAADLAEEAIQVIAERFRPSGGAAQRGGGEIHRVRVVNGAMA
ncbi:MAG TPA: galactokinase family protein [Candidatus Dormibacteraeota bacterium]|nr:galactokinase family protein [Candidatus Dormibacteraeota bacterium]